MNESPTNEPIERDPNFVFGGNRVISEANWPEYEAQGVRNVTEAVPADDDDALRAELEQRTRAYGAENILLGDAYDAESGRPLQHKPGVGVYVTAEGLGHTHPPVLKLGDREITLRPGQTRRTLRRDAPPGGHA